MFLQMSFAKWQPLCSGLNDLTDHTIALKFMYI